jgi:hypothetical protein
MPTFKITSPQGKTIRITGDQPPSREEVDKIFATIDSPVEEIQSTLEGVDLSQVSELQQAPQELTPIEKGEVEFQQEIAPHQKIVKDVREEESKARTERRLSGDQPFLEKAEDVLTTTQVTESAEAPSLLRTFGGISSLPARALGVLSERVKTGEFGDIKSEETKLFKGSIEDLNEWVSDRENQNINSDILIENLKTVLETKDLPEDLKVRFQDQINEMEDAQTSGAITKATDIIGNLALEIGSDPLTWIGIVKDAVVQIPKIAKKTPAVVSGAVKDVGAGFGLGKAEDVSTVVEKTLNKTLDDLSGLNIQDKRFIELVNELPGETVKQKLTNIRREVAKSGEVTPKGELSTTSLENKYFGGDMKATEELLESQKGLLEETISTKEALTKGAKEAQEAKLERIKSKKGLAKEEVLSIKEKELADITKATEEGTAGIRTKAGEDIGAVETVVSPEDVVGKFTREGEFAKGNVGFEEAQRIGKETAIPVSERKLVTQELLALAKGDVERVDDFTDTVNRLWNQVAKDAPVSTFEDVLRVEGFPVEYADAFKRIKQGNVSDLEKVKKLANENISAKGTALSDFQAISAKNLKSKINEVVKTTMEPKAFKDMLANKKLGGSIKVSRETLLKAMGVNPQEVSIIDDIFVNDAIEKLDVFLNKQAQTLSKTGKIADAKDLGRFKRWKKHFGIDANAEIINRAKKLDIEKGAEEAVKGVVSEAKVGTAVTKATASEKATRISKLAEIAKGMTNKRLARKLKDISKSDDKINALKESIAKNSDVISANKKFASDFRKEVDKYIANGYDSATDSFKSFVKKNKDRVPNVAKMVEDEALSRTLTKGVVKEQVSKVGEVVGAVAQTTPIPATISNKIKSVFKTKNVSDENLLKVIDRIKKTNKEAVKDLKRLERQGIDVTAGVKSLKDNQAMFDYLAKNHPISLFDNLLKIKAVPMTKNDKFTILKSLNEIVSTELNARQRMELKRIKQKLK